VPVKLHWNLSGALSPHVAAGPQLAFIVKVRSLQVLVGYQF